MDSWPRFDALKNAFFAEGAEAVRDNAHRMIVEGIELDIIPFGGVAEGNQIAWPPEREIIMAVDGFAEVSSHTVTVRLDNGENLPFCSLPGLALLKLLPGATVGMEAPKTRPISLRLSVNMVLLRMNASMSRP